MYSDVNEVVKHKDNIAIHSNYYIEEQKYKIFSVPKPNAIINPGAVVVHIQNSSVSAAAVMSTLRFKNITYKAVSLASAYWISLPKPPKGRNFSWICEHGLKESPHDHEEENMKYR